jgi:hypothetical protein
LQAQSVSYSIADISDIEFLVLPGTCELRRLPSLSPARRFGNQAFLTAVFSTIPQIADWRPLAVFYPGESMAH